MEPFHDTVTVLCCRSCLDAGHTLESSRIEQDHQQQRWTRVGRDGTTWTHVTCLRGHLVWVSADRGELNLGLLPVGDVTGAPPVS